MNQSWSDYDSDWFVSLNSTATDIVVVIFIRNRQITSLTKPAILAGIFNALFKVILGHYVYYLTKIMTV